VTPPPGRAGARDSICTVPRPLNRRTATKRQNALREAVIVYIPFCASNHRSYRRSSTNCCTALVSSPVRPRGIAARGDAGVPAAGEAAAAIRALVAPSALAAGADLSDCVLDDGKNLEHLVGLHGWAEDWWRGLDGEVEVMSELLRGSLRIGMVVSWLSKIQSVFYRRLSLFKYPCLAILQPNWKQQLALVEIQIYVRRDLQVFVSLHGQTFTISSPLRL
jgi:hypothetical protein